MALAELTARADPAAFLRAVAREPWVLGWSDCVGVVARWIEAATGRAATAHLPPANDAAAVAAWLARHDGLHGAMTAAAADLGLAPTSAPAHGDVAHLALGDGGISAGIRLNRMWMVRTTAGLAGLRAGRLVDVTAWAVR